MYEMQKQGASAAAQVEQAEGQLFLLTWPDNKARALDVSLGACLGYGRPLAVRKLVRKLAEAGELGELVSRPSASAADPGGREYWLTEEQALLVCARSAARGRPGVMRPIIEAFVDARYRALGLARQSLEAGLTAVRMAAEVLGARAVNGALAAAPAYGPAKGAGGGGGDEGPMAALDTPAGALTLRPGESVVITRTVDTSEYFTASSIGREFGVSGQVVGRLARELGLFAVEGYGVWREFVPNDGTNPIRHWLYGAAAKAALRPHLERRRDESERRRRRSAEGQAPNKPLLFGEGGGKASRPLGTGKEAA
ncbi:MAG TPA: hypothetical protein VFS43_31365 [Polyangiaceae bacterium]|nr:hypothetical protein [Polyangiaceae bacterium]